MLWNFATSWIGIYVIVCIVLMYIMMCGQTKFHRTGFVGRLHTMLSNSPSFFGRFVFIAFSCSRARGNQRWAKFENRLMNKKNPAVMLFYIIVVGGATGSYAYFVIPSLRDPQARLFSYSIIAFAATSFITAVRADPGIVTPSDSAKNAIPVKKRSYTAEEEKKQNNRFEYNGYLYDEGPNGNGLECKTCLVGRPARSKHCSLCGHCVRRFDHHCPWINSDVAENNHRYFIAFLYIHSILCLVAAFDSWTVADHFIQDRGLWTARFVSRTGGHEVKATWHIVLMYVLSNMPWVMAIGLFAGLVGLVLVGFTCYQLRGVFRGITTNESNKLDDVMDFVENVHEYGKYVEKVKAVVRKNHPNAADLDRDPYGPLEAKDRPRPLKEAVYVPTFIRHDKVEELIELGQKADLTVKQKRNIAFERARAPYNRGWLQNFRETMFPHASYPQKKSAVKTAGGPAKKRK